MRRIGRWTFNGLAVLSLLLFALSTLLFVRSQFRTDEIQYTMRVWHDPSPSYEIWDGHTDRWGLILRMQRWPTGFLWATGWRYNVDPKPSNFGCYAPALKPREEIITVGVADSLRFAIPYWLQLLAFATAPTIFVFRWNKKRRRPKGLCPKCGYDLRATPDRCPECGTVVANLTQRRQGAEG